MRRFFILPLALLVQVSLAQEVGHLIADGSSDDTYALIRTCGYFEEVPDTSRDHSSAPFQHITQQDDTELGKPVFVFHIHAEIDDDRGIATITDRQRNEIKTGPQSPEELIAQEDETLTMSWKLKLPEGMQTTSKFSHIHQLKGIDNDEGTADVGLPLMTLTCYTSGSKQVLRLRYEDRTARGNSDQRSMTLAEANLSDFLGVWVEVEEVAHFGSDGFYSIVIRRISDREELFSYSNDNLDMWRTGSAGLRPKWGIYRYIGEDRSWQDQLRDEQLLYADFSVVKGTAESIQQASIVSGDVKPPSTWAVDGKKTLHSSHGIYIKDGKKYLEK